MARWPMQTLLQLTLAIVVLLQVNGSDDSFIEPMELGDMEDAPQDQRLQLGSSSAVGSGESSPQKEAMAKKTEMEKLVEKARDRRKKILQERMIAEQQRLGIVEPETKLSDQHTRQHKLSMLVADKAIVSANGELKSILAQVSSDTVETPPSSADPDVAKVQKEQEDGQAAVMDELNRDKVALQKTEQLGKALEDEEKEGPFKSAIGLTRLQSSTVPYLAELDMLTQTAAANPSSSNIKKLQQQLVLAARQFARDVSSDELKAEVKQRKKAKIERDTTLKKSRKAAKAMKAELKEKTDAINKEKANNLAIQAKAREAQEALNADLKRRKVISKAKEVNRKRATFSVMLGWDEQRFFRTLINGPVTGENLIKACAGEGTIPVCNKYESYDGQCFPMDDGDQSWQWAKPSDALKRGVTDSFLSGKYFYETSGSGFSTQNLGQQTGPDGPIEATPKLGNIHSNNNKTAQTFCTSRRTGTVDKRVKFGYFVGIHADIKGIPTEASIVAACKRTQIKGYWSRDKVVSRPVCNSYRVQSGGQCVYVPDGDNLVMSDPETLKNSEELHRFAPFSFFYNGDEKATLNFKVGTRVAAPTDYGGRTVCAAVDPKYLKTLQHFVEPYYKTKMTRAKFSGTTNATNILKACKKINQMPVCAEASGYDGECRVVSPSKKGWSWADPLTIKREGMDNAMFVGTYFYTGLEHKRTASFNTGCCGAVRSSSKRGGETWCVPSPSFSTIWRNYNLTTMKVPGEMNNTRAAAVCEKAGMKPVCNNGRDYINGGGGCYPFEPTVGPRVWKFSNPDDAIAKSLNPDDFTGVFMYTANETKARGKKPMGLAFGDLESKAAIRNTYSNGQTLCAKPTSEYLKAQQNFSVGDVSIQRVPLPGDIARSKQILAACHKIGLVPVCARSADWDGMCTSLGDPFPAKEWNLLTRKMRLEKEVRESSTLHASLYTGSSLGYRSFFLSRGKSVTSSTGMSALCTEKVGLKDTTVTDIKGGFFNAKSFNLVAVKVKGDMNGANARTACAAIATTLAPTQQPTKQPTKPTIGAVGDHCTEDSQCPHECAKSLLKYGPTCVNKCLDNARAEDTSPSGTKLYANVVQATNRETNDGRQSTYGGVCTCPNGQQYSVSDTSNCASLHCTNGVAGQCNTYHSPTWSGKRVVCGKLPTTQAWNCGRSNSKPSDFISRAPTKTPTRTPTNQPTSIGAFVPVCDGAEHFDGDRKCQPIVGRTGPAFAVTYGSRKVKPPVQLLKAFFYAGDGKAGMTYNSGYKKKRARRGEHKDLWTYCVRQVSIN